MAYVVTRQHKFPDALEYGFCCASHDDANAKSSSPTPGERQHGHFTATTMTMSLLSSTMLRRIASASGRRLRPSNELVATRTFSTKFNDLEPLEKKENILPVRCRLSGRIGIFVV
jgi:hypothetical protein